MSKAVQKAFLKYDRDGSGTLDLTELSSALKTLGMPTTTDEARSIMAKYDSSQDGRLDLTEFNGLVTELLEYWAREPPASRTLDRERAQLKGANANGGQDAKSPTDAIQKALKSDDVSRDLMHYRLPINELFEHYSRLSAAGGSAGASGRISSDAALKMLRDFKLCPAKIAELDARTALKSLRQANPQGGPQGGGGGELFVLRREFNELLLRFSLGAAEREPGLRQAPPKRKLHALLADLSVSDPARLSDILTSLSRDAPVGSARPGAKPKSAARSASEAKAHEALALKLQAAQRGRTARAAAPQATSNGFKKLKPIELIVHDFTLSPAGAEALAEQSVKAVQLGAILGGDATTLETSPSSFSLRAPPTSPNDNDPPEPVVADWAMPPMRPGRASATFKILRKAMYKPPLPAGMSDVGEKGAAPTEAVRQAFNDADYDRSGAVDERELAGALKALGMEASPEETASILAKYDRDQSGRLELGEFTNLVQELRGFQQSEAEKSFLSTPPALPLRIMLSENNRGGVQWSAAAEVAYAELNIADGVDRRRTELPLFAADDGGLIGFISVTIRCSTTLRPFLAVRKAFSRADTDRSGSLSLDEVLPVLKQLGVQAEPSAVIEFNRADVNGDGKLTLLEFDKLYRHVGKFDEQVEKADSRRHKLAGSDPYAVDRYAIAKASAEPLSYPSSQPTDDATAGLYVKQVPLRALEPERPYTFWVEQHARLEILEVHRCPDQAVRHAVMMTARDADGRTRVERAVIFDGGAYFNLEPTGSGKSAMVVKGGPSWSFPGPAMYELMLARAPAGAPNPPLPIRMRMVTRFEAHEQMDEHDARHHPLISQPRKAQPQAFAGAIGASSGGSNAGQAMMPYAGGGGSASPLGARGQYQPMMTIDHQHRAPASSQAPYSTQYSGALGGIRSAPAAAETARSSSNPIGADGLMMNYGASVTADPFKGSANAAGGRLGAGMGAGMGGAGGRPPSGYVPPARATAPAASLASLAPGGALGEATLDRAFEQFDTEVSDVSQSHTTRPATMPQPLHPSSPTPSTPSRHHPSTPHRRHPRLTLAP